MVNGEDGRFRRPDKLVSSEIQRKDHLKRIAFLNQAFSQEERATQYINKLSLLPNPICVDYNNTLVDSHGYEINPQTSDLLSELREIGTVVIVSVASFNNIVKRLNQHNLSHDEMVVMPGISWTLPFQRGEDEDVVDQYISLAKSQGYTYPKDSFFKIDIGVKRVGGLFMKPEVPLIDDNPAAFKNNYGVLPILYQGWPNVRNSQGVTFPQAIEKIKERYAK
jgi:hypothetical protein